MRAGVRGSELTATEYDVIPAGTRTKDDHYIAATQQLERAEDALRSGGAGPEDEPISVTMAKSRLHFHVLAHT